MAKCLVTGTVVDGTEAPIIGAKVYLIPATSENVLSDGRLVAQSPVYAVTTSTGAFSIELIQGTQYEIIIREVGLQEIVGIPASATATLSSLLGIADTEDTTAPSQTGETNW